MDFTDILAETGQALKSLAGFARRDSAIPARSTRSIPIRAPLEAGISVGVLPIDGIRLSYLEDGPRDAPAIVYIHGANVHAQELFASPLGGMLAKNYHVIAFDRPGYGGSGRGEGMAGPSRQAALIHRALGELGIRRPVMAGHSWGGSLVLAYAAEYPQDVAGIVSMSGWCFPGSQALLSFVAMSLGPYVSLMKAITSPEVTREWGERMVARAFEPDPVPPGFANMSVASSLRRSQLDANAEDLRALNADMAALEPRLRTLAMPAEILVAMQDRVVEPAKHGLRLAKLLPAARLTRIDNHGHMAHHLDPQPAYEAITRLIGR